MSLIIGRELVSQYEIMKATCAISFLKYHKTVLNAVIEVSFALSTLDVILKRSGHVNNQVITLESSIMAAEELFKAGSYLFG